LFFLNSIGGADVIEATEELIACAVSVVRKRLQGAFLSDDAKQDIAAHVCYRCTNDSATASLAVWRGACDYLAEQKKQVLRSESELSEENVAACHAEWLQADQRRVQSLEVGKRYGVSGRYGVKGASFAPALPYETASRNRWFNLNNAQRDQVIHERASVVRASGATSIELRDDADDFAAFFAARECNAVEA
jgi:hypothetical protein